MNRLGGEVIASFNYRARFLPKWHDLCERPWDVSSRRRRSWNDSTLSATPCWVFAASRNAWTVAPRPRRRWSRAS